MVLSEINDIKEYLIELESIHRDYIVLVCTKGAIGTAISDEIADLYMDLGFKTDISHVRGLGGNSERAYTALLKHHTATEFLAPKNKKTAKIAFSIDGIDVSLQSTVSTEGQEAMPISIAVTGQNWATNGNGINIVVYDPCAGVMVDSVCFDTSEEDMPCSRYKNIVEGNLQLIDMIHAAGYSVAQYLLDQGIEDPIIYCPNQFIAQMNSIVFSIRGNNRLRVKDWVSDKHFFYDARIKNTWGTLGFITKMPSDLTVNDTIIVLSPICSTLVQHSSANVIKLYKEIHNIRSYAFSIRPIIQFRAEHPDVRVVCVKNPATPTSNLSKHERTMPTGAKNFIKRIEEGNRFPGLEELTTAEAVQVSTPPPSFIDGKGRKIFKDMQSRCLNVINGRRLTIGQPETYTDTVYLVGNCSWFGHACPDEGTLASSLQSLYNRESIPTIVKDHSGYVRGAKEALHIELFNLPVQTGDTVIIKATFGSILIDFEKLGIELVDFTQLFQRPHDFGEVFAYADHCNQNGLRVMAEQLFPILVDPEKQTPQVDQVDLPDILPNPLFGIPMQSLVKDQDKSSPYAAELQEYKQSLLALRKKTMPRIGSIVMNCNPFTLGHRYLIEYASSRVDHLYIFAVEEDKSVFAFKDRFKLMQQGTADLPNVTVLPSGKFIISSLTFSGYFNKEKLQDTTIDPSQDVELFAKEIAPVLDITVRFAGEEPLDLVTNQYNEAMRRILPQYGVEFEVIPRKESDGEVISASRVRKLLETKDFDAIAKIVPPTTLHYLQFEYMQPE